MELPFIQTFISIFLIINITISHKARARIARSPVPKTKKKYAKTKKVIMNHIWIRT